MATKNYEKMTTKKLEALLKIASDEEKALINEELQKRAEAKKASQSAEASKATEATKVPETKAELSPEETAAIEGAEETTAKVEKLKKAKLSLEELSKIADECQANVKHKCQIVPFNTAIWVNGVIVGVVVDKRSSSVLYAVKTEDGRRIVKKYDSPLIKIFDEIDENTPSHRGRAKSEGAATVTEAGDWDMEADIEKFIVNVGRKIKFDAFGTGEEFEGRIMALVPDKRVNRILYRIKVVDEELGIEKIMHKVATSTGFTIAEDFDEEGAKFNEQYCARRNRASAQATPEERVAICEEAVKKAEAAFEKAKAALEAKKAQLEAAKAELNKSVETEVAAAENSETAATESPEGSREDLM